MKAERLPLIFCVALVTHFARAIPFENARLDRMLNSIPTSSPDYQVFAKTKKVCLAAEDRLVKISVPRNRHGSKEMIDLYYEKRTGVDPNQPVIIVLPGGPGAGSIGMTDEGFNNLNSIYIDPRGTGCNFGDQDDFLWSDVSTDEATSDVIDIIRAERLTNFVLYGLSYGTVLATRLAVKLENAGLPPKAVVLTGVLGKAWDSWTASVQGYVDVGNAFLADNPKFASMFNAANLPLGFSNRFWAFWVSLTGHDWQNSMDQLQTLQNPQSSTYQTVVQDLTREKTEFDRQGMQIPWFSNEPGYFVVRSVLCSELSRSYYFAWPVVLQQGQIAVDQNAAAAAPNLCPDLPYTPYDSSLYQVRSPIIYFQGDEDPNTPIATALYHYNSQVHSSKKVFVRSRFGGHCVLASLTCSQHLWMDILSGQYDFSDQLDVDGRCKIKPALKTANPS